MEDKVLNEAKAMKLCRRHRHVVEYVNLYLLLMEGRNPGEFLIVMLPRADCNLDQLLLKQGEHKVDNVQRAVVLQRAPGCLIQAMQFSTRKASIITILVPKICKSTDRIS
jgi:hypothetical protein